MAMRHTKIELSHVNVRFPKEVYSRLSDCQRGKPHFSLNALIVEAVERFLDAEQRAKEAKQ
jgi:hypothetical protein